MTTLDAEPQFPKDEISKRAADFFERQRFGGWTYVDQAEFNAWLTQSVHHEVAYLRLEGIAAHTERLVALQRSGLEGQATSLRNRLGRGKFVLPLLMAAATAGIAIFGAPLLGALFRPADRTYSTDVGGRTLLSFADHTQIELNTNTSVRYRMTNAERIVWLDKGEAWFHVAHNAANPFTVVVGKHRVTDLGTEFLVRRGADRVEVALLNGRAALSTDGAQAATLRPGDDAVATPASVSVSRRTPQELADELSWRRGVLVFRNARLADAVREFNRYNESKLVIADPAIADLKFTVEIKSDNFDGFVRVAQALLNVRADRRGNDVFLSRAVPEKTKGTGRSKHAL